MDKYKVKLLPKAYRDLNNIYSYIAKELEAPDTADAMADLLENAILGLDEMPYRGAERKVGSYANRGYRQLFEKNYTIIYRIDEAKKTVIIVTIKYTPSNF